MVYYSATAVLLLIKGLFYVKALCASEATSMMSVVLFKWSTEPVSTGQLLKILLHHVRCDFVLFFL